MKDSRFVLRSGVGWRGVRRPASRVTRPWRHAVARFGVAAAVLLLGGCDPAAERAGRADPPEERAAAESVAVAEPVHAGDPGGSPASGDTMLVDPSIEPAVAGEGGWNYQQSATADLDGDQRAERVVLTAQVEMYRSRPAWDDGQRWQVYVEEEDGARTYLYARFVQLGTVTMRVAVPEGGRPASVVLIEHLPDRLSVYEVEYRGPGAISSSNRFQRTVDPRGDTASPALP